MVKKVFILASLAAGSLIAIVAYKLRKPLVPVTEVNLQAYLGTWFQAACSPLPMKLFQRNGYCIKATYNLINNQEESKKENDPSNNKDNKQKENEESKNANTAPNNLINQINNAQTALQSKKDKNLMTKISVLNEMNYGSREGPLRNILGYAYIPDSSQPGKLKVHFDVAPRDANYWILALGPIIDGQYEWAVVSEPKKLFMWVLVRDLKRYQEKYETEVRSMVENKFGFNHFWNRYLKTGVDGRME